MVKELEKKVKSFFDEYRELKEKCRKLMEDNNISEY